MLLAGMSGVTALSTTLQAMHENKLLLLLLLVIRVEPELALENEPSKLICKLSCCLLVLHLSEVN